jgi:hypothetical protein
MTCLDIEKFKRTERVSNPFQFLMVPEFLKVEALKGVNDDFPLIEEAGNFDLEGLSYGPRFKTFIDEIKGPVFHAAMEEKFGVSLAGLHHLITIRAISDSDDGHIHTDSPSKTMTALIYLNQDWNSPGGRLRLLRNGLDLDDYIAEVPPIAGTLLAFKRSDNSWHGHKPFIGPRRTIQINWIDDSVDNIRYRVGRIGRRLAERMACGLFRPAPGARKSGDKRYREKY